VKFLEICKQAPTIKLTQSRRLNIKLKKEQKILLYKNLTFAGITFSDLTYFNIIFAKN